MFLQRLGGFGVSQLMTLFVEVGVEAKLGLQDPGTFCGVQKKQTLEYDTDI